MKNIICLLKAEFSLYLFTTTAGRYSVTDWAIQLMHQHLRPRLVDLQPMLV